jgi:hypothetical protein
MIWKLSPSDLTFLWDECPRCFYLKVRHQLAQPQRPMAAIYNRIDRAMKLYYRGRRAEDVHHSLPEGVVEFDDRWVESAPYTSENGGHSCYFRGKFDSVIRFADGSYAVIDFKTSEPRPEHVPFYGRQLHAYAYAMEHPAAGGLRLGPVTRLGLVCIEPDALERSDDGRMALLGQATWLEIPRDDAAFFAFVEEVLARLAGDAPPPADPRCLWCRYREAARATIW